MKVKIISGCNEREVELQVQQEIDAALNRGEKLIDAKYSTAAAVLLIFETKN